MGSTTTPTSSTALQLLVYPPLCGRMHTSVGTHTSLPQPSGISAPTVKDQEPRRLTKEQTPFPLYRSYYSPGPGEQKQCLSCTPQLYLCFVDDGMKYFFKLSMR